MSEDKFLDRVREDARQLRYEIDAVATTRVAARIRSRLSDPTVAQWIAGWFRPLAAALSALALIAGIGITLLERNQTVSIGDPIQYEVAGDTYSVGE
jgi:hypothetical protein